MNKFYRPILAIFAGFFCFLALSDVAHAAEDETAVIDYDVDLGINYGCERTTAALYAFPEDRTDTLRVTLSGGTVKEITPADASVMLTDEEIALLGTEPSAEFSINGGEPMPAKVLTSFVSWKSCPIPGPSFSFVRFCPEFGVLLINDGSTDITVKANGEKFIMASGEQRTASYDANYELHLQAFGTDTELLVDTVVTLDVEHCGGRKPTASFVGLTDCLGYTDGTLTLNRDGVPGVFHFGFINRGGEVTSDVMTFEDLNEVELQVTAPDESEVPVTFELSKETCEVAEPPIPSITEPPVIEPTPEVTAPPATEPQVARGPSFQVTDTVAPPDMMLPATGSGSRAMMKLAIALVAGGFGLVGTTRLGRAN